MSTRPIPCYQFVCDFPGCDTNAQEGGEFSGWGEEDAARDDAVQNDWHMGPGMQGYCREHPSVWASDVLDDDTGNLDMDAILSESAWPLILLDDCGLDNGIDADARLVMDAADLILTLKRLTA